MKNVLPTKLKNELQSYKIAQVQRLGHNVGIVKQQYDMGDMCHEVGINRSMSVELRCCTEDEISHWVKAKRRPTDAKMDGVPQAVLVSVQEDETCIYRAKVCTPVLCPDSLTQNVAISPITTGETAPQQGNLGEGARSHREAFEAAFQALNQNGEDIQVKIFTGNDVDSFNEMIQAAQNGFNDFTKSDAFSEMMQAIDLGMGNTNVVVQGRVSGKSIREVLQSTLGVRSCLLKNLGW
jgi:hypothetical protein